MISKVDKRVEECLTRKELIIMCEFRDSSNKRCKVSPSESQCYRDDNEQQTYCLSSYNFKSCGNYEAYQRGEYKIER